MKFTEWLIGVALVPPVRARVRVARSARRGSGVPRGLNGNIRTRPLDAVYPCLWLDARYEHVREGGRVVSMAVIVAYGARGRYSRGARG